MFYVVFIFPGPCAASYRKICLPFMGDQWGLGELMFRSCYTKGSLVQWYCSCGYCCDSNVQKSRLSLFSLLLIFQQILPSFFWCETNYTENDASNISLPSRYLVTVGWWTRRPIDCTLIRQGLIENYASNISSIVACIRYRVKCLQCCCLAPRGGTQLLRPWLTTVRGLHMQTHRLMGGIYEVGLHHWDGVSCHDISTEFRKDLLKYSEVDGVEREVNIYTYIYFFRFPNLIAICIDTFK
jgi:hypothetical protein